MYKKILAFILIFSSLNNICLAESLFRLETSRNVYSVQPRPLFSSVRAKSIGDLVTIEIEEEIDSSDELKLDVSKSSDTEDRFSALINKLLPFRPIPSDVQNFGGEFTTKNNASVSRKTKLKDTVTAQVIQILGNGNLVIQGKKVAVNAGERMEMAVSGIIDPRLLDNTGRIKSNLVANLQVSITGKGTVSRADSEGTVNRILRILF